MDFSGETVPVMAAEAERKGEQMRARRPRSRFGCHSCKRSKIKCDEAKPSCSSCRTKGRVCDYSLKLSWNPTSAKRNIGFQQKYNNYIAKLKQTEDNQIVQQTVSRPPSLYICSSNLSNATQKANNGLISINDQAWDRVMPQTITTSNIPQIELLASPDCPSSGNYSPLSLDLSFENATKAILQGRNLTNDNEFHNIQDYANENISSYLLNQQVPASAPPFVSNIPIPSYPTEITFSDLELLANGNMPTDIGAQSNSTTMPFISSINSTSGFKQKQQQQRHQQQEVLSREMHDMDLPQMYDTSASLLVPLLSESGYNATSVSDHSISADSNSSIFPSFEMLMDSQDFQFASNNAFEIGSDITFDHTIGNTGIKTIDTSLLQLNSIQN
ncbi:hypothetical protein CANCADRAFT_44802 [Tortispora caseinolytica NRRL Y-17796]|uniref:Zn(2)-C6 fungal-type domain-containing protein n=1 Tax=Tortispora caseinolytica NRRL Y-17796 TaxID=767744 RepID=A0A1E4THF5_9ASCO|nr:hypothetical protein CANCADRAFT_44802 [Tortispora caseinolytica NRRL Y-17796]